MNKNDDMVEALRLAMMAAYEASGKPNERKTLIMNRGDYQRFTQVVQLPIDAPDKFGDQFSQGGVTSLLGMDIQVSSFTKPGEVFIVPKPALFEHEGLAPIVSVEQQARIEWEISNRLNQFFYHGAMPYDYPFIPPDMGGGSGASAAPRGLTLWQRRIGESLLAWGNRLSAAGLLDNPAIRWQYQKAVLSLPFVFIRLLASKVKALKWQFD